jgi:hypothetical protein
MRSGQGNGFSKALAGQVFDFAKRWAEVSEQH